jgi:hypothetical protein
MNSNYKIAYSFFLFIFLSFFCFGQQTKNKHVSLVKKQNGKRLEFYAKNTDSISYSVFLRIATNDYRRSSNRPVLKVIPANSEIYLITLIKLADKPGDYQEQFVVNKVSQNLRIRKDYNDFEINIDDALKTEDITIFESDNCKLCQNAKSLFNSYDIPFKLKTITSNYKELALLLDHNISMDSIKKSSFILQIKSNLYININTEKALIDTINNYNN